MALRAHAAHTQGSITKSSSLGPRRVLLLQQFASLGSFAPRPVVSCAASVGHAHSHLGEALLDMQQARREAVDLLDQQQLERLHRQQQQHLAAPPEHVQGDVQHPHPIQHASNDRHHNGHTFYHVPRGQHAQHRQHGHSQHVFRDHSGAHRQHYVFRSTAHTRTRTFVHSAAPIPHLDGDLVDAAAVLTQLRSELTEHKGTVIVTADHSAAALLDLVSVMVLLDEDVRQADPGSVVLFQPVLDLRRKLAASKRQLSSAASRQLQQQGQHHGTLGQADEWGDGMAALQHLQAGVTMAVAQQHAGSVEDPVWDRAAVSVYGPVTTWSTNVAMTAVTQPVVAALITKARCPKLALQQPSYCITACAAIADVTVLGTAIVRAVYSRGSVRLKVAGDASDLVSAWHAMRHARMIVRGQSGAANDLLITPHLTSEPAPAAHAPATMWQHAAQQDTSHAAAGHVERAAGVGHVCEHLNCKQGQLCEDHPAHMPFTLHTQPQEVPKQQLPNGVQPAGSQQQGARGVMYFNIWLR